MKNTRFQASLEIDKSFVINILDCDSYWIKTQNSGWKSFFLK
ncbi:hypothetical protein RHT_01616 [Candidatus Rhabdochlamydia sp. T3358]|nr:hypothetical protein RHT_01616 [Candidatus Rhabdochlamydia sp. T3358]